MSSRPKTSGRNAVPAHLRPVTAASKSLLMVPDLPSTARFGTARPGTRTGLTTAQITVIDRPMTQQGLSGMKTSIQRSQRLVQDKSFFLGLLRTKIKELNNEITRLAKEVDKQNMEQSTYLTYDKRAKALAQEINDLQGELGDYNMLVDKLNTDTDADDVLREYDELKAQNEQESNNVENIFAQRRDKESQIQQLEKEIEEEKGMTGRLVAAMKPEMRDSYLQLKQINAVLQEQMNKFQQEIDAINLKTASLEDEVSMSQVIRRCETVCKYSGIRRKKDNLLEEEKSHGTPAQEQERLLKTVKEDNQEIATMERKTNEFRDKIAKAKEDLLQIEQDLEENQNERSQKYRELRKKDESMTNFLDSFDDNKTKELKRKRELEDAIVSNLQHNGMNLSHFHHIPSQQELMALKDDLSFKENEMEKSKSTSSSLAYEQQRVNMDLQKIEQLEEKIKNEMLGLEKKMKTMEEELVIYNNVNKLKSSTEEKRRSLTEERTQLSKQKEYVRQVLQEEQVQYDSLKGQLNENETHTQLTNLERKWQHVEQTNFAIKEFIASRLSETDYKSLVKTVNKQVADYNGLLQKKIADAMMKR
uniref:Intraflagellar transport protein 74 homolog n=1 Tax=Strigamia maritima TaxID=126957 RepID=T1JMT6_STRMM